MDRSNNSGRKKRVANGTADVKKRGSGLHLNNHQPVGNSNAYQDRTGAGKRAPGRNQPNSLSLLASLFSGNSKIKKYITILVLIVVAISVIKGLSSGEMNLSDLSGGLPGVSNVSDKPSVSIPDNTDVLNTKTSPLSRQRYTKLAGNGKDKITIMVYMCGTDLESKYGMATADLKEMMDSDISENMNVIIETGGTKSWHTSKISNAANQIYQLTSNKITLLEDDLGRKPMTDADTLSDFIMYCSDNYPADRYMLIMWDHGGGTISGFGYDEVFPGKSMTLDKISTALKDSGCKFDLIGFDACLMATLETAITIEPYADYLIASEETEPGNGWYYTSWLTALSKNSSMPTLNIGKNIIDDFIRVSYKNSPSDKTTLSLIDLAEMKGTVPEAFSNFSRASAELINNDKYKVISDARSNTREFAPHSKINQIDVVHFAENIATEEAKKFSETLLSCIKYNRTSANISNAYGLSIYFPYNKLNTVEKALATYEKIGMNEEYSSCVKSFSNLLAGGQIVSNSTGNPLSSLLGSVLGSDTTQNAAGALISNVLGSGSTQDIVGSLLGSFLDGGDFSSITGLLGDKSSAWFDPEKITDQQKYYENNYLNANELVLSEKNGGYVLSMSDENWNLVQEVELNVFFDDGEGYIDLGLDNVYQFDNDGDLLIDYDGTWLTLNGHIVAYYMISDDRKGDQYTITGRVPALLNNELVDIILVFNNENPNGIIAGARINYEENVTDTIAKGLIEIKTGDRIDFLCDYYTYDGEFIDSYYLGEQMTVDRELSINNMSVGNNLCKVTYCLTDMYNNKYWTPSVEY